MVVAFLAAVALAKYRFTGNKLFVVLVIGILMLPQAGLVIPLYVVLARYGLTNELMGLVLTHLVILLPFAVWTLRGFILGIPKELEEAAMVDGSSRLGAFTRILLPLVAPGLVATSVFVFITSWNEYIFANVILTDQSNQTLTVWLSYFYGTSREHRLGRAHGRVDADGDPGRDLLPPRAAEDRLRLDGGRRQGVMATSRARASSPRAASSRASRARSCRTGCGDASRTGSAASSSIAWNVESRDQLRALTDDLRSERADLLIAIDEEGGDVTRLEAANGSSYPGNAALGVVDDVALTRARRGLASGRSSRTAGVNLDFAPVADVNTNAENPVIGIRSFGSDGELVARHVAAFVRGLQRRRRRRVREALPRPRGHVRGLAPRAAGRRLARGGRARTVSRRDRGGRAVDHDRAHRRPVPR